MAYVTLDGKVLYLGPYDSPESRDAYDKAVLERRESHGHVTPHSTTVGQLCLAFMEHADEYYRDKYGQPTGEADNFRKAMRPLFRLYRHLTASEFGPKKLIEVRKELIDVHVRPQVNKHVHRLRHVFKWGAEREMVPHQTYEALKCVSALRRGRSSAAEGRLVVPVPDDDFNAAVAVLTRNVSTTCRLLLLLSSIERGLQ